MLRRGGELKVDGADGVLGAALESAEGAGVGIEPASGVGAGAVSEAPEAAGGTGPMRVLVSSPEVGAGAWEGVSPVGVEAVSCR